LFTSSATKPERGMDEALLQAFQRGERRALARLLSLAARGHGAECLDRLPVSTKQSRVVAVTGSGGVGKSTLIGKLIEHIRGQDLTVAVLACDPQSPLSGGALLGDRFRMPTRPEDDGVFIRSVAAESGHGATAKHLAEMVRVLQSFGFDVILIETVGAGQGDTAVRDLAQVFLLLLQPETGDDLQWEKAGVLEVADIIAIHKADLPGADNAVAQVRAALDLSGVSSVPVLKISSRTGDGVAALWEAIINVPGKSRRQVCSPAALLQNAQEELKKMFEQWKADPRLRALLDEWNRNRQDGEKFGKLLLKLLCKLSSDGTS
jgi:LAO/AO transport system ATPase